MEGEEKPTENSAEEMTVAEIVRAWNNLH